MERKRILIKFFHGLGDVVQFTIVLRHLRVYRPDWSVEVVTTQGKHTALAGLCDRVYIAGQESPRPESEYFHVFAVGWYENYNRYKDRPNSKVTNSLQEEFAIDYDPALASYVVNYSVDDYKTARLWLQHLCGAKPVSDSNGRLNAIVFHYQGNTSPDRKNLDHELIRTACQRALRFGYVPVILDWDNRSPVPDNHTIFCPRVGPGDVWGNFGSGCAAMIAALIDNSSLFVGIDSGPGKVASSTTTPNISVWTKHHPIQFHDPSATTLHLVPDHVQISPSDDPDILKYFEEHYNYKRYKHLATDLLDTMGQGLGIPTFRDDMHEHRASAKGPLTSTKFDALYYEEHKRAGLDYAGYGAWQETYGRWLVKSLHLDGKHGLDIGCACGAIAWGLQCAGMRMAAFDVNNHMIHVGRQHFPALVLAVCDAVNLHLVDSNSQDLYHSNQVGEHWRKDYVPLIFKEAYRVLKPGGVFFWVADTIDLFERQGRLHEMEDPTNQCVERLQWWIDRATEAGLVAAPHLAERLTGHPDNYFQKYDWDWFVMVKP